MWLLSVVVNVGLKFHGYSYLNKNNPKRAKPQDLRWRFLNQFLTRNALDLTIFLLLINFKLKTMCGVRSFLKFISVYETKKHFITVNTLTAGHRRHFPLPVHTKDATPLWKSSIYTRKWLVSPTCFCINNCKINNA